MTALFRCVVVVAALAAGATWGQAQGTLADYERARDLRKLTENKVFKTTIKAHWFADDTRFWYRNDLAEGAREFILVDAEQGTRGPAFDHERLATALTEALGKEVRPGWLPIDRLEFKETEPMVTLTIADQAWCCDLRNYELTAAGDATGSGASLTPEAAVRPSRRTGAETAITFLNRTAGEVKLFWINGDGERRPYGSVAPGDQRQQHTFAGHIWLITDPQGQALGVFEATADPGRGIIDGAAPSPAPRVRKPSRSSPAEGVLSPDEKWRVFIRDANLYSRCQQTGNESALTTDGTAEDGYSGEIRWAPDSRKLVALRTKKGDERKVYYVESAPKDQLQPRLHSYDYLKPGDRIPLSAPELFHIESGARRVVSSERFPNPWSITHLHWPGDSKWFAFLYNQRGHQVLRVIAVDAESGCARTLVEEESPTFIDYAGKQFLRHLDASSELIWMSERDGWNHLYLYDTLGGQLKNPITQGEWVVRGVDLVDEAKRQVWFRASGIRPGQDPYDIHYCRVNFDGSGLAILTEGAGTHSVEFSPNRRFLIDSWSRVDLPPVHELRRADDGGRVCELERADWDELLKTGWRAPERFVAKGRDDQTDIHGIIVRPTHFDPAGRYPIIEEIYAGPQSAFVPKSFQAYYAMQSLAELGFIVVKIDGMGTSHRSKSFHDVCWKNLGDSGFPDRILWIKAAAAQYPFMDLNRAGIYGGSAGGQSATRALLAHGDFYKVAVSDCGCHDNRMDKIWWNELWMGWPIGPQYEEQSNVSQAHRLQGKLLLIVGEMDQNVDPASTMQVVDALIKADKDFDLLLMTGKGHGAAESDYGRRRRADFFVRHLLGVEPRWQPQPGLTR